MSRKYKNPCDVINELNTLKAKVLKLYPKFLDRIVSRFIFKKFNFKNEKIGKFAYATICNKKSFNMVLASIYSLQKNFLLSPSQYFIVSDGSWRSEDALKFFSKYGLSVTPVSWETCAGYYRHELPELSLWAEKQIWGKKMASILYLSERTGVLFSDPDILWYSSPFNAIELENLTYKVSVDNSINYDDKCISHLHLEKLLKREPVNCGVVYLKGGLATLNDNAINCIKYESENPGKFAEQTVFAALDEKYDCRWKMTEIFSDIYDVYNIFSCKNSLSTEGLIARHYLWLLKWAYWHDFFKKIV